MVKEALIEIEKCERNYQMTAGQAKGVEECPHAVKVYRDGFDCHCARAFLAGRVFITDAYHPAFITLPNNLSHLLTVDDAFQFLPMFK